MISGEWLTAMVISSYKLLLGKFYENASDYLGLTGNTNK
jgi:hypothetical protein